MTTLQDLTSAYMATRGDDGGAAQQSYRPAIEQLLEYFAPSTPLDSITEAGLVEWLAGVTKESGKTVAAQQLHQVKTIFRAAVCDGWIAVSPAERVPAVAEPPSAYVDVETTLRMLDVCSVGCRLAVGLARFAGLGDREVRNLRWSDVELTARRIRVDRKRSGERVVPMFEPLPQLLAYALKTCPDSGPVMGELSGHSNLGVKLSRDLDRAGIKLTAPFRTLRGSCATDLQQQLPYRAVNAWLTLDYRRTKYASEDDWRKALELSVKYNPTYPWE